ncbi:MAG TPA: tetratricopeptide repeat protein [Terracidiphilus sp.]|nr:tetratricopeptide repeat protein [Terracidiphilus sp.]
MREIGSMIYFGQGVPTDFAQTVKWYRRAADAGLAQAQNDLGSMYYRGVGVPKDRTEAAAWFRKAAEQGNVEAAKTLASMYKQGDGVPMDPPEADLLLRLAGKSRDENAAPAVHRGLTTGAMTGLAIHFLFGAGLIAAYFLSQDRFSKYGRPIVPAAGALCLIQAGLSWLGGAFRWFGTLEDPSAFAIAYFVLECGLACLLLYIRWFSKDGARAPADAPGEAWTSAPSEAWIPAPGEAPEPEATAVAESSEASELAAIAAAETAD